jgi:hypothetical protein
MSEKPAQTSGETPVTGIEESDPNADSAEGLAGDMGVSSERKGPVRGQDEEVTYAAAPTHEDGDAEDSAGDALPEQSAFDGQPESNPPSPGRHESDPDSNPRHGV